MLTSSGFLIKADASIFEIPPRQSSKLPKDKLSLDHMRAELARANYLLVSIFVSAISSGDSYSGSPQLHFLLPSPFLN